METFQWIITKGSSQKIPGLYNVKVKNLDCDGGKWWHIRILSAGNCGQCAFFKWFVLINDLWIVFITRNDSSPHCWSANSETTPCVLSP